MPRLWQDQQSERGLWLWAPQQAAAWVDTEPPMGEEEGGLRCARSTEPGSGGPRVGAQHEMKCCQSLVTSSAWEV